MPNGFGVNWPGHATAPAYRALRPIHITPTGAGMATAAATAVRSLATAAHITIPGRTSGAGPAPAGGARAGRPERRPTERYRRRRWHRGRAGGSRSRRARPPAAGPQATTQSRSTDHTPSAVVSPAAAPRGAHCARRPLLPPSASWLWQRWPSAWSVDRRPRAATRSRPTRTSTQAPASPGPRRSSRSATSSAGPCRCGRFAARS